MMYLKYYIKNFKLINRVILTTIKINILLILLSERQIIKKLSNEFNYLPDYSNEDKLKNSQKKYCRKIERIIDFLPLKRSCLVKSLVIKKILFEEKNFRAILNFGISYSENVIKAHCWINDYKDFQNYKKVYSLR